jgi:hypothetical protein
MVAAYFHVSATTTYVVVRSSTDATTGTSMCSCSPARTGGFACVSDKHKTSDDLAVEKVLKAIERRDEFRCFIGRPAAVAARPLRFRHRAHQDKRLSWKTRALGRLPGHSAASG